MTIVLFLIPCAEEPDPSDDLANLADTGGSSSGSECNKENSRPSSADPCSPRAKPLSRRQRKNRRREDGSSPDTKKKSKAKKAIATVPSVIPVVSASSAEKKFNSEPGSNKKSADLPNYEKLHALVVSDLDIFRFLRAYLLSPEQMLSLGYPVEHVSHPGCAVILKSAIEVPSYPRSAYKHNKPESRSGFDVNAREFVPNIYRKPQAIIGSENSSEHDSGNSSDSGENDSEEGSDASSSSSSHAEKPIIRTYQQVLVNGPERHGGYSQPNSIYERTEAVSLASAAVLKAVCQKTCVRCGLDFFMSGDNSYVTQDTCLYHWGKLAKVLLGDKSNSYEISNEYSCCRGKQNSRGCTEGKLHVWNGLLNGWNGPFDNYVKTRPRKTIAGAKETSPGVYSLDCEMCFTGHGLELVKMTVVTISGKIIYDVYVKPENEIVDYNSRFSGVTAKDMQKKRSLKTLKEVQNDLMGFINAETILIGHGLENDLRALRILHPTVIDTAVSFPHQNGLPYRRSLKSLISYFLKREIQTGSNGHNSFEDARACMDLMLWRVRKDFRNIIEHSYEFSM